MRTRRLQLIVEGYSEKNSLKSLITRFLQEQEIYDIFPVKNVINTKSCSNIKRRYSKERPGGIEHFVNMAFQTTSPDAILILLDADEECLKREKQGEESLGPWLLRRACTYARGVPIGVVVANRVFEAWIVAAWSDIATQLKPRNPDEISQKDQKEAESRRGHAEKIGKALGRKYSKIEDPKMMVKYLPFEGKALQYAPSYHRFLRVVKSLAEKARKGS